MKLRNFLTSLVVTILLAGIASAQTGVIIGNPPITFQKRAFEVSMFNALNGKVMGWQYVLIKKGVVVSENAGGLAQNAADGNVPMTVNTPTNIGSLAKFLSGTAMLGLMEKPGSFDQYDNGLSLDQKLERKIWTVMPNAWINDMTGGVENISFRQLLQHRTGFDTFKDGNRTVLGYLEDSNGFLPAQFDKRQYANINFVLNGYLLSLYTSPSTKLSFDAQQQYFGWNDIQADMVIRQTSGTKMHNLMKTRIWDKMTPKILPNCDAANTLQNVAAYGYSSVNDATTGQITSAIDNQGHCAGQGGYFLSMRGLANYLAHFAATDLIVNQDTRTEMVTNDMNPRDQLVWSFSVPSYWYGTRFNMPNIAYSNGVAGGWRSVLIRLPEDYYLVAATNSPDLDADAVRDAGLSAFIQGMKHNFD
jgi:CubicO group peptidase (beta-lactamase class C family)